MKYILYISFLFIISSVYGQIQFERIPSYNYIQKLYYTGGTLWVIAGGKVLQILPTGDVITHSPNTKEIYCYYYSLVFTDKLHRLWLGSEACFDGTQWIYFENKIDTSEFYSYSAAIDSTGNIFFYTDIGLIKFSDGNFEKVEIPTLNIRNIVQLPQGKIAITDSANIYIYNSSVIIDTIPFLTESTYKTLFFVDSQNRFWCRHSEDTLAYMDDSGWHLKKVITDFIPAVCEDKVHNIWFAHGCSGKGVSKYNGSEMIDYSLPDGLCSEHTWALACAPDSSVKIGTWRGMSSYKNNQFTTSFLDGYASRQASDMLEFESGHYMVSGEGAISENNNGVWSYYILPFAAWGNYIESDNSVGNFKKSSNGHIWATTTRVGIFEYDGNTWINHNPTPGTTNYFEVAETSDNHVWIGSDNGLFEYDGVQWTRHDQTSGVPHDSVGTLIADSMNLWIGTPAGLFVYEDAQWNSTIIDEMVLKILKTNEGIIWALTNEYLYKYDNGNWYEYTLPQHSCYQLPVVTCDQNGNPIIYLSGTFYYFAINAFDKINDVPIYYAYLYFIHVTTDKYLWYGSDQGLYRSTYTLNINQLKPDYKMINIYPNPTQDYVIIDLPEYTSKVEIININGELIKQIIPQAGIVQINVKNLSAGLYAVRACSEKGTVTTKFVKE